VEAIVERHEMLRLRVDGEEGRVEEKEEGRVLVGVDLREVREGEKKREFERVAGEVQKSLDLKVGPVVRVGWIMGKEEERVVWAVHHMAVDAVSWRILMEDLERSYEAGVKGEKIELGWKTNSYAQWAEGLKEYGRSEEVEGEAGYWMEVVEGEREELPRDKEGEGNLVGMGEVVEGELGEEETKELMEVLGKKYRVGMKEAVLSGVVEAVGEWSGRRRIRVEVEGHGREEVVEGIDVSRTVGWFTSVYPVEVGVGEGSGVERLRGVKRELERAPWNGIGYGLLRYGDRESEVRRRLQSAARPQILFNYLGVLDAVFGAGATFTQAPEKAGPTQSDSEARLYDLEITCFVFEGSLRIEWKYCKEHFYRETLERLSARALTTLRSYLEDQPEEQTGSSELNEFELAEEELLSALESVSVDFP